MCTFRVVVLLSMSTAGAVNKKKNVALKTCALWSVSDNLFQRVKKCSVHINVLLKPFLDLRFTTRDVCTCFSGTVKSCVLCGRLKNASCINYHSFIHSCLIYVYNL